MANTCSINSPSDVASESALDVSQLKNFDFGKWATEIQEAIGEPNAELSNLEITRLHYRLSQAMREVLGCEAGANFHTWAVWGSRKAGVTIRQEDRDQAARDGAVVGGIVGAFTGFCIGVFLFAWSAWGAIPAWALLGAFCGGLTGRVIIHRSRRIASRLVLHGNRIVLEDIGLQSARFIEAFRNTDNADPEQLQQFLAELHPGGAETDGQDLLKEAFSLYWRAKYATDLKVKQEATYFANCLAVLHEHIRLQPIIKSSLPWIISKCITQRLMQFDIGQTQLDVCHDVPSLGDLPYPSTLMQLHDPELIDFLYGENGWDNASGHLVDTAAQDWTKIRERMRYIVNLFRVLHLSPAVWQSPCLSDRHSEESIGLS